MVEPRRGQAKARGDAEVRRLIDAALEDSEVTVVLIGQKTYKSRWVRYEIEKSIERNDGLLGVYIDNIRDAQGRTSRVGRSPFGEIADDVPHFDWIEDDGREPAHRSCANGSRTPLISQRGSGLVACAAASVVRKGAMAPATRHVRAFRPVFDFGAPVDRTQRGASALS